MGAGKQGENHMTRAEGEALLRDIIDHPDDDTPRLVYADWLDDHGDGDRAELIRVQCRLASLPEGHAEASKLAKREKELLKEHGTAWSDTHLGMVGELRRGFIEHVTTWPHNFIESGAELVSTFPVRSLRLRVDAEDTTALSRLAGVPALARITHLSFERPVGSLFVQSPPGLSDAGLRALLASEHLVSLRDLDLSRCWLYFSGVQALAEAPLLRSLERLELSGNSITHEAVRALAESPHLAGLRYLGLSGTRLSPVAAQTLASSRYLRNLRELDLSHTRIQTSGVQALVATDFLANMEVLRLAWLALAVRAAQALAKCSHLAQLRDLDLARNRVGDLGAKALAGSPHLAGLRRLVLRRNKLTAAGVAALGESGSLKALERLEVGGNEISIEERKALRERFGKSFGKF
jgi:uncharacterized protein (TIGR02996 family)